MVRWLERCGILAFALLVGWSYYLLLSSRLESSLGAMVVALPLAFYLADLLTGMIHWVCDSFGSAETPVWGPMLVGPFRRHHKDPLEITRITLAENLGSSSIAGFIALMLYPAVPVAGDSWMDLFRSHLWLAVSVFAVVSNLFHRWSHIPASRRPLWLSILQKYALVLPSHEHLVHHARPYRVNYCILCGWANPLTNWIPWSRIEAVLARIGIPTNFE